VETYCGLALSGQWSGRYPGLCVQAVGSGLCGQRLWACDERIRGGLTAGLRRTQRCVYKLTAFTFYLLDTSIMSLIERGISRVLWSTTGET